MRLLIEGYKYDKAVVEKTLHGIFELETIDHKISINYVGYFYNPSVQDCVFILPKVLIDENDKVFKRFSPEELIDVEKLKDLKVDERKFIYEFAIWIYRAIAVFNKDEEHRDIVYHKQLPIAGNSKRRMSNTFLDVVLALIKFNKENENFFTFIVKNLHSGCNKINWTRTIAHSQVFMQNGTPIYMNPVNKKRQVNFDEELLVIFFSILNHINEKYGFNTPIRIGYELITGSQFDRYINGYGRRRLNEIKYKYFTDKSLRLWELCHAFFQETPRVNVEVDQKEYMLVKNFNIVFETMIDDLLGDKDIPVGLKNQYDGKIVDHIYDYQDLVDNNEGKVYYIGDSKYYKSGASIGQESVYKQFTYAKNLIQWNMDVFQCEASDSKKYKQKEAEVEKGHRLYRDDTTEGYNIIPNFFISAMMKDNLSFTDEEGAIQASADRKQFYSSSHFSDRLYDRDTLLIFHYDVNFLYIVSLYARDNKSQQSKWSSKVKDNFRTKIQEELKKRYQFYAMTARPGVSADKVIKENFRDLIGRIAAPYDDTNIYSLALPISSLETDGPDAKGGLWEKLNKYFSIDSCDPGSNPEKVVTPIVDNMPVNLDDTVLVGCVKSLEHWEWIKANGVYNIRIKGRGESRRGAKEMSRSLLMVQKVMLYLYNEKKHATPEYLGIFELANLDDLPEELEFRKFKDVFLYGEYPNSNSHDQTQPYLIYRLNMEDAEPALADTAKSWIVDLVSKQSIKGEAELVKRLEIRKSDSHK